MINHLKIVFFFTILEGDSRFFLFRANARNKKNICIQKKFLPDYASIMNVFTLTLIYILHLGNFKIVSSGDTTVTAP